MSRWLRILGSIAAVCGCIVFIGYMAMSLRPQDLAGHLTPALAASLVIATLLSTLVIPIGSWSWKVLLDDLGHRTPYRTLNAIMLTTQAGKYLPGNVGQHFGKAALALAHGVPSAPLFISMAYELVLLLMASCVVGISLGLVSGAALDILGSGHGKRLIWLGIGLVAALAAIPLLLRLVNWAVHKLIARNGRAPAQRTSKAGIAAVTSVVAIDGCAYLVSGLAFTLLAMALAPEQHPGYLYLTAAYAIAWTVGFVVPGAPAGVGVRESILLMLLSRQMPGADASLLVLAQRIATTLADILCFAAGAFIMARIRRSKQ
ncbi:MAG TPA: lysylphosphatidylglycerol synthase domain-containing protein [Pseudoxanthomonas sp.]|nr:lysylphosphatidylglycerol synthase domain-containing protein [Pseudoxanthomonas sp.]